ncbi:unnamed protein product [Lymnaea stagnalis]|uniref:Uncharacterized protein n=1 Tax=Lymnaea stagnalis TaxID=6523 RepID=A0AAV2IGS7_LYMST
MATYFAMFNGHKKLALAAIQSTHSRACYELYSDVLLITNAMLNSHHRGNFRFEGHEVNLDAQKTANAVKHRITNASFKAKKLPDDIDIVEDDESTRLSTVEEDQEHSLAKNLKAKLMNKLGVDKNKNRETVRRNSDTPSMKSGSGSEIVENLGVAIRNSAGGAGMHVMVDHLEMVPLKVNGSIDDDKISSADGKHVKSSSSPTIYSKKSNLMKTLSGSDQPSKGHQLMSPHNSKNSNPGLKSPLSKVLTPDPANSARAQSEGPTVLSDRSLSDRSPFQRDQMGSVASYTNVSDPNLRTHGTLPSISVSSHSMPADIVSNSNSEKSSGGKQLVNRNSFSTDL